MAKDPALTMLIISGGYIVAITLGAIGAAGAAAKIVTGKGNSPFNPAVTVACISSSVLGGKYDYNWGWVFILFPMLGSLCGILFFELVYMRTHGAAQSGEH